MKRFLDKPYMEGICPCCGSQIEYGQRNHMDNGGTIAWECPNCEASGEEGFDEVFDGMHYNVCDADGNELRLEDVGKEVKLSGFVKTIRDLDKLISKDEIHKFGRTFHFNAIALNKVGIKNLFKIISLANTVYLYKTPRILRSKLNELREGLLIGSGCYESEVFIESRSKEGQELTNIINFYDYVEVQPPEVYNHLIQTSDFKNEEELKHHIEKIINATKEAGKIIVATGDVHHFEREDKIYREIIVNQKVPGGGRHPLAKKDIKSIPSQHFRTTREMLDDFSFIDDDLAYEIVVTNTNKVLDMVEELEVIPDTGGTPFSPRVKSDDGLSYLDCPRVVTDLVYDKANAWYGEQLPYLIEERLGTELYGDIVLTSIKDDLKDLEGEELTKESFKKLHEVIVNGKDSVLNQVRNYLKRTSEEELTEEQIKQIKKSIEEFGMNDPIGVWSDKNIIVEGHGRLQALKELGYTEVDCIRLDHLTDEERKAYSLVHNKLTMNTDFDFDRLEEELNSIDLIDMSLMGFEDFEAQSYIADLLENEFSTHKVESDKFSITLNISTEYEDAVLGYIKDNGKDDLVDLIVNKCLGEE